MSFLNLSMEDAITACKQSRKSFSLNIRGEDKSNLLHSVQDMLGHKTLADLT